MAQEFRLPDIGEGLTEAEIVRWLVAVGESVRIDQPVVEVETDKAVVEIPSPYAGVVLHHGGNPGETIAVGSILVVIGSTGEVWPPAGGGEAAPIVGTLSEEAVDLSEVERPVPELFSQRVTALPLVRRLAKDLGVDLEKVPGSGPEGRITREDVETAARPAPVPPAVPPPAPKTSPPTVSPSPGSRVRLSRLRKTIAANMVRSWQEIPHVTTFDTADAGRLLAAKKALSSRHGAPVSLDALLVKAVLPALAAHPEMAARIEGEEVVYPDSVDVGVAVDTDEGLMVVVVRDAATFGLVELSGRIAELAEKAKTRSATPEDLAGQNFTLSNIGAVGGGFGTPIVPPGTTAILSVGRAREEPVARDGEIGVAWMMPLSLSYDHRLIDGAKGRRFMAMVIENLEEPTLFLA